VRAAHGLQLQVHPLVQLLLLRLAPQHRLARIGNFYGRELYNASSADDWDINFAKADCGYGLTQQTDGMRLPQFSPEKVPAFAYQTQRAVALDYATNIAAGLQTLQDKWDQTRKAGMTLNNGDASKPENWYYAA
jgi:hypothetical protein